MPKLLTCLKMIDTSGSMSGWNWLFIWKIN